MKRLESEILQLRRENATEKALSALIRRHCFPKDANSTPLPPTEPGVQFFLTLLAQSSIGDPDGLV